MQNITAMPRTIWTGLLLGLLLAGCRGMISSKPRCIRT